MEYAAGTMCSSNIFTLPNHERRSRYSGWRGGFVAAIAGTAFVLLINITCAIVVATTGNPQDGIATAYTGDCEVASRWTTGLHLLINVLSSALLGASSYCMQRLVAPTREEIQKAHAKGKWLDVGVLSLRNLSSISKSRLAFWILLALSSIPLHFLYNSVVFETIATNSIDFLVVNPTFFTTRGGFRNDIRDYNHEHYQDIQDTLLGGQYLNRNLFENITNVECQNRYISPFITSGNGFGVPFPDSWESSSSNPNSSLLETAGGAGSFASDLSFNFTYCLSEITPQRCAVQFSQIILYVVIACNIVKVALMVVILWWLNQETIVTVGDAIKSFIQRPDQTTEDCCLMSRQSIDQVWKMPRVRQSQRYQPTRREPWYGAVSGRRWGVSLFFYMAVIVTTGYLFHRENNRSLNGGRCDGGPCPRNGFGNVDFHYLLEVKLGSSSVIPYVLLANLPQFLVSFLYLTYNGLFTAMLANREWTNYAHKRAALRVTAPSPTQRSTYFLSLPFTYSLPLILASILLHWFISQSIFVARIAVFQNGKELHDEDGDGYGFKTSTDLGFSDSALIATIVWGCALVVTCLAVAGICTYPKGMPVGATNSAVLSAACHVKRMDRGEHNIEQTQYNGAKESSVGEDIVDRPLQWGVTVEGTEDEVGHCCFSDQEVELPETGCLYAGVR